MKQKTPPKEEKSVQLDLDIKEPFVNKLYKIKGKIDLVILRFEVKKFLKDPLVWGTFIIASTMLATQILKILQVYDSLPSFLPIFQTFMNIEDKLIIKEYILIYPIITTFSLILGFILLSTYYNREKSLIKITLFTISFVSLAQSITLIQLIESF